MLAAGPPLPLVSRTECPSCCLPPLNPAADHEFVDPHSPSVKHIVGQAAYQLLVMHLLVFHGPELLGVADAATLGGAPSAHYTMVFNTFVLMQVG